MELSEQVEVKIRFSEVDALSIVWHGNYPKYFEDAREAFGIKYNLGYMHVFALGYVTPLVNINIDYKRPIQYTDRIIVKITYIDTLAAKLVFNYEIRNEANGEIIAIGSTTQVFLSKDNLELCLTMPEFFECWKKKWGLCG